jgi:hypothetical protein
VAAIACVAVLGALAWHAIDVRGSEGEFGGITFSIWWFALPLVAGFAIDRWWALWLPLVLLTACLVVAIARLDGHAFADAIFGFSVIAVIQLPLVAGGIALRRIVRRRRPERSATRLP